VIRVVVAAVNALHPFSRLLDALSSRPATNDCMPCLNRPLGCSEPVQTAASSRSHRRLSPSPHDLFSDLVANLVGPNPPGILWTGGTAHHHKHFRHCSNHRKHKPLCSRATQSPHRDPSLDPLDDPRSRSALYRRSDDGSSLRRRRLALPWSRRPSHRRGHFSSFSTRNLKTSQPRSCDPPRTANAKLSSDILASPFRDSIALRISLLPLDRSVTSLAPERTNGYLFNDSNQDSSHDSIDQIILDRLSSSANSIFSASQLWS